MYVLLEVSATNTKQNLIQNITQTHTDISTQNQLTKSRKWVKKKFCFYLSFLYANHIERKKQICFSREFCFILGKQERENR